MKTIFAATVLLVMLTVAVFADIARPEANKSVRVKKPVVVDTTLSISLDRDAKEARLLIPRSQLKQLRADLESLDVENDNAAAAATNGFSRLQTIVSGLFLSLAFIFAGVWFVRSGKLSTQNGKIAAAGMILFAVGAWATVVYGNAGPPSEARSITGKMFTQAVHMYGFGSGKVKLEVSDEVTIPKLIVPNPKSETPGEE